MESARKRLLVARRLDRSVGCGTLQKINNRASLIQRYGGIKVWIGAQTHWRGYRRDVAHSRRVHGNWLRRLQVPVDVLAYGHQVFDSLFDRKSVV